MKIRSVVGVWDVVVVPVREEAGVPLLQSVISFLRGVVFIFSMVLVSSASVTSIGFGSNKMLFASLYICSKFVRSSGNGGCRAVLDLVPIKSIMALLAV